MPSKPRDFLETARTLLDAGTRESDFRSAASRAYYAAFHVVKGKTSGKVVYNGSNEHGLALEHVTDHWKPDLAEDFRKLQDRRIEADYYLDETVSKARAQHLLDVAREFVERVYSGTVT